MTAISCVMLTTGSRLRSALRQCVLRCLADQTYQIANLTLVIASEDPIRVCSPLREIARFADVRFVPCPGSIPISAKRNLAVDNASGPWVTFWDDDDWSAPVRLAEFAEAARLVENDPQTAIIGQTSIYFHELSTPHRRTYRYAYAGPKPYVVGGTMMFRKALWSSHPFEEAATRGDEGWWLLDRVNAGARVLAIDAPPYIAMIHGDNAVNRVPRLDASGTRVLSDGSRMIIGGREEAAAIIAKADVRPGAVRLEDFERAFEQATT